MFWVKYFSSISNYDGSGLVWSGLVWSGLVWSGLVWSGLVWSGLVWSGLVWSGLVWSGLVWSGLVWSGLVWSGLVWSGLVWSGLVWSGLVWSGLVWSGLVWSGLVWSGLFLSCLVLSCLVLSCLVWSGLVWSGLVWFGLVRPVRSELVWVVWSGLVSGFHMLGLPCIYPAIPGLPRKIRRGHWSCRMGAFFCYWDVFGGASVSDALFFSCFLQFAFRKNVHLYFLNWSFGWTPPYTLLIYVVNLSWTYSQNHSRYRMYRAISFSAIGQLGHLYCHFLVTFPSAACIFVFSWIWLPFFSNPRQCFQLLAGTTQLLAKISYSVWECFDFWFWASGTSPADLTTQKLLLPLFTYLTVESCKLIIPGFIRLSFYLPWCWVDLGHSIDWRVCLPSVRWALFLCSTHSFLCNCPISVSLHTVNLAGKPTRRLANIKLGAFNYGFRYACLSSPRNTRMFEALLI